MKKILALILAVLMLLPVLVACKKDADDGQESGNGDVTTPASTDPTRVAPEVKNFDGYEFKMILLSDYGYCGFESQVPEKLTGEGINDTLFQRNQMIEDLYNVKFQQTYDPHTPAESFEYLSALATSGEYFADIYSCSASKMLSSLATAGYFLNLYDLNSLRLDKEWWDQDFLEETTINARAYMATGDIQTNDDLHQISIAMNLDLYEETFTEKNFYEIVVKNGAWTFEEFYNTWYGFGASDGGTVGKVDGSDRVGYFYDSRSANYLYMAAGMKVFTIEQNEPRLSLTSEKALKISDYLQNILDGNTSNNSAQIEKMGSGDESYAVANQHFSTGNALFLSHNFHDALKYHLDMEDTIVYPPFPKYDLEQDRYYSLVHMCFEPYAISSNVKDPERTALIMEALCFYSDKLEDEVMDILIQERLTAELEPREILQLSLSSKVYDMEYMANILGWTEKANNLFTQNKLGSYQSDMKSLEGTATNSRGTGKLQLFLKNYAGIGA